MERWGVARLEARGITPPGKDQYLLNSRVAGGSRAGKNRLSVVTGYCLVRISLDDGRGDHGGRWKSCGRLFLV